MKRDCAALKEMVLLFRNELIERVAWEEEYPFILSDYEQISPSKRVEAYSWIFFEIYYEFFWEVSDRTKKTFDLTNYPEAMTRKASSYYGKWGTKIITVSECPTITAAIKEIYKYKEYGIPSPNETQSLIEYLIYLRGLVIEETYGKKIWVESLSSFLEFIRERVPFDCKGFIDVIFPEDRKFYSDTIIRLIRKEKYPTNMLVAGQILMNMSDDLIDGDVRAQFGIVLGLGFAWICLTNARLQLPTEMKLLRSFDIRSLHVEDVPDRVLFPKKYLLKIPTLFGEVPIEISKRIFDYLSVLGLMEGGHHPFLLYERVMERALQRAIKKIGLDSSCGSITYTTLTSFPVPKLS